METRVCQNCKQDFIIDAQDFDFYTKIKVPPPTFCPECRLQRRLAWRNERGLYRRKCDAPGHEEMIITMYPPELTLPVYDQKYWWSDAWDPMEFAREYDFSRPFFEQWKDLLYIIPAPALINLQDVDSDYCNFTYQSKNCYLNFASDMNEDTAYLYHSIENRDCFDMLGSRKNEKSFQLVDCEQCYDSEHLQLCQSCIKSKYCYDCHNCQDCIGCTGLRNKKCVILNVQYTQVQYQKELEKHVLHTREGREIFEKKYAELLALYPRRYSNSRHAIASTGDYLNGAKNCQNCFDIEGPAEDLKYCVYGVTNMKNIYDAYAIGVNIENSYDMMDSGSNVQNVRFSANIWESFNCQYSYFIKNCSDCFGCVGIRNKKYCIFNKQYTKEQYEELLPKIIAHMDEMPFIDTGGCIYKYGEFFPIEMSFFPYNQSIAHEYFPLASSDAIRRGYGWRAVEDKTYTPTKEYMDIPSSIYDVSDDVIKEVISCAHAGVCTHQCTNAFRVIPAELQMYQRLGVPFPTLCVNCRHHERLSKRNPLKLWTRECMCSKDKHQHTGKCANVFQTSYSPESSEIVYCEQCYQKEVI